MIYTTVVHILRRAYHLSINEYCVLDSITQLSGNPKFDGWCITSQKHIADELDLSRDTVNRAYRTLELKGLIILRKKEKRDTAVMPSQEWCEVRNADKNDIGFILKKNGIQIGTIPQKFNMGIPANSDKGTRKFRQPLPANSDTILTIDTNKIPTQGDFDIKNFNALVKWLKSIPSISLPVRYANSLVSKYSAGAIKRALNSTSCTNTGRFREICEQYDKSKKRT